MDTAIVVIANLLTVCGLLATGALLWVVRQHRNGLFWFLASQVFSLASVLFFDLALVDLVIAPERQEILRRIPGRAVLSLGACYFLWTALRQRPQH